MKKITYLILLFLWGGVGNSFAQVFSQNFSSSNTVSSYANATTPNSGQFTYFSAFGSSPFVIDNGRLKINKTGTGSAQAVRNVNFATTPKVAIVKFKVEVANAVNPSTAITNHGHFFIGNGFENSANLPDNVAGAGNAHSKFGFSISGNSFSVNIMSALNGQTKAPESSSQLFSGEQQITFVVNNSDNPIVYQAPDASFVGLENDKWDLWVGTTKVYSNQAAFGATVPLNQFRFGFHSNITTTNILQIYFDDINVYNESILPLFVTFNTNGGSAVSEIYANPNQPISQPSDPNRTGYTFGGWYKEATFNTPWNFTTDVVTAPMTLYAKWTPITYAVTFESNGGTAVNPVQVNYNSTFAAPTEPTKTEVIFGGWYKEATLTTPWNFATDVVTGNTTLYAKWNDPRQSITFPAISDKVYGEPAFTLAATSSSGLPVAYEALTNNITISGSIVTITNTGLATIKATQTGNADYNAATPVQVSFTINKATQILTFDQPTPISRYAGVVALTATSSSGLPVGFTANEPNVGIITSDNKLQVKGLGTIKITASQAGNEFYLPATNVEREVLIHTAGNTQLLVTQALSPNGDGINDVFVIEGIKAYPENQVKIMNRGGMKVYEQKGYNNTNVVFAGKSSGGDKLPDGTYYYSIEFKQNGQWVQKKGYLFIKN
ncbi:InlB B-repeat-containing protein [Pedobacter sp.]|uniref:InlB B-repeat-containing protein n=1 Tax=Pedobacter sp. TaxID=1411316 RepID=UPI0031CEAC30